MSLFSGKSNGNGFVNLLSDFSNLLFPDYCLGCSLGLVKGEDILCTRCILELPKTGYHFMDENPVKEKFLGRIQIKHASAFLKFRKAGIVQHLLHQLKYNGRPELGVILGRLFGREIERAGVYKPFDVIIPMPLHQARLRRRGYNQSTKFAEGIALSLGVPYSEKVLQRKLNTATQTKKTKLERWENVRDAFEVIQPSLLANRRILLVDDIITTGASLEACGKAILDCQCSELSIACIAEVQ